MQTLAQKRAKVIQQQQALLLGAAPGACRTPQGLVFTHARTAAEAALQLDRRVIIVLAN